MTAQHPQESGLRFDWDPCSHEMTITYLGSVVFDGTLSDGGGSVTWEEQSRAAEAVHLGYDHGPADAGGVPEGLEARSLVVTISGKGISLEGRVHASEDSFACAPQGGPEIVRSSFGQSRSLLNKGVYDRTGDWALSVAELAECTVRAERPGEFSLKASGDKIKLVLDIEFYRVHRGYFHWSPEKALWKPPVAGWCSWAAHFGKVTEQDFLAAADFLARDLVHYGYDTVQLDDGYQLFDQRDCPPLEAGQSMADLWLNSNERFPHGLKWLAGEVSKRGITPGIWFAASAPPGMPEEWYVKDESGKPYKGPWVNYMIDGALDEAVETAFLQAIRGFKEQGWRYFKIDTTRHVLYDSYRMIPDYWRGRELGPEETFRRIFKAIADEIGPDIYYLSCWGTIPEIAGIPDGCRIGEDVGADWASVVRCQGCMCRFNYLNNVIWLNDPDYMVFRLPVEQCRTWASIIALTGCQLMVSDPVENYDEERLDILRKVGPPLFTRPANLRQIEPGAELWLLEIDDPAEPYVVLARTAWSEDGLPERWTSFEGIGLDADGRYLVFDFWNERFVGEFTGRFPAEKLVEGECRVYAIRPAPGRPQVLSTNRHISQGAHEIEDVTWWDNTLSGVMKLPPGRPFSLFVHVPEGYRLKTASGPVEQHGPILKMTMESADGGAVQWSMWFDTSH